MQLAVGRGGGNRIRPMLDMQASKDERRAFASLWAATESIYRRKSGGGQLLPCRALREWQGLVRVLGPARSRTGRGSPCEGAKTEGMTWVLVGQRFIWITSSVSRHADGSVGACAEGPGGCSPIANYGCGVHELDL